MWVWREISRKSAYGQDRREWLVLGGRWDYVSNQGMIKKGILIVKYFIGYDNERRAKKQHLYFSGRRGLAVVVSINNEEAHEWLLRLCHNRMRPITLPLQRSKEF